MTQTESTTAAPKAKSTKPAASPFDGILKFEIPKFDLSNMEMPKAFREMAETSVERTRDACAKAQVVSDEAADFFEKTYEATAKRAIDYNHKLIEMGRTNTRTAFECIHDLLSAKSPSEFIELSTAQMRKQFEIASAQNKELCAFAQEMATKAVETVSAGVSKTLKKVP